MAKARSHSRFPSAKAAVAVVGFALNLVAALGGAFYVGPARKALDALTFEAALETARSQMIRAATAFDNTAEQLGSLVFVGGAGPNQSAGADEAIQDLRRRALAHRRDGVRAYIAALALAGAVDFEATSQTYEALAEAERRAFTRETYGAANAFEADLATRMVTAQGEAALGAIKARAQRAEAKRIATARERALVFVSLAGATLVFAATMAGTRAAPAPRGGGRLVAVALARLRAKRAAGGSSPA